MSKMNKNREILYAYIKCGIHSLLNTQSEAKESINKPQQNNKKKWMEQNYV